MSDIDMATFGKLKERMKTKFPILLEGYLRDAKNYLVTIGANLPSGELATLIDAAHSLKSTSGLLGITPVHKAAETLEYAGKTLRERAGSDHQPLAPLYQDLQNAFAAVEGRLQDERTKAKAG